MATSTLTTFAERFLGVSNPEYRAQAMTMPLNQLVERLQQRLSDQALLAGHALSFVDIADDNLPKNEGTCASEAAIYGLRVALRDIDNLLCELGGYCEALVVRAAGAVGQ